MYQTHFMISAVGFILLTVFVFCQYPASWRKNRMFIGILTLWHLIGSLSLSAVFVFYRYIPFEGIKYELVRIATFYYIMILLLSYFYFFHLAFSQAYRFIRVQKEIPVRQEKTRLSRDKRLHAVLFTAFAFGICTTGFFWIDFLHDTRYEVRVLKPAARKELNICLLSDIHAGAGNWSFLYDDLAKQINQTSPDVILFAGDVFDETTSDRDVEYVSRMLKSVRVPEYGMYYVYGNHDNAIDRWAGKQMESMGVTVLEDEMVQLDDIQLIGRMDPGYEHLKAEELVDKLQVDLTKPAIVLEHRPRDFKKLGELGYDLAMAGHTHGFNIPQFMGANLFEDMYYGRKEYGGMTAVTTSGVSAWGFHYKWPAVSEVVTIHVTFKG